MACDVLLQWQQVRVSQGMREQGEYQNSGWQIIDKRAGLDR